MRIANAHSEILKSNLPHRLPVLQIVNFRWDMGTKFRGELGRAQVPFSLFHKKKFISLHFVVFNKYSMPDREAELPKALPAALHTEPQKHIPLAALRFMVLAFSTLIRRQKCS